jgi:predicted kinase
MNEIDRIRYSRRGQAFQQAQQMKADAIAATRGELGIVKATQKASEDVSGWLREQYEAIERELPN